MPARSGPRVTIIMSVRDAALTLPIALASLRLQTLTDWELLAADDGSRDGSGQQLDAAAVADPRVRVFRHDVGEGLAVRLNQLATHASTPLIARMDADDVSYPERLARQVAFLAARPEVDLVGTSLLVFGAGGRPVGRRVGPPEHDAIARRPHGGFALFHPSWLGRTGWFQAHPYDPAAVRCEDQDLLFRTHRRARFANLTEILLGYREDRLDLGDLLDGRLHMAQRWSRSLWVEGRRAAAAATIVEQLSKGAVDALSVSLSAERALLRHRARPIASAERAEWARVWDLVTREVSDQSVASPQPGAGA